ncbi:MAG: hypothetical protein LDL50_00605 [Chloroflexi bacterium]|nr:hypothetical protein [Chloroflexota bacterium]MCA2000789.1 hypothetical protein [Chloroflexota bacterium]
MSRGKILLAIVFSLALAGFLFFNRKQNPLNAKPAATLPAAPPQPTPRLPAAFVIPDGDLKDSVVAAGAYLARHQLPNGELSYQADFINGGRSYSPSLTRLMGGAGALYTVCRVSNDLEYCDAGDLALDHYLEALVEDPQRFRGACLYAEGVCPLSGAALTVDTIYKRWQARADFLVGERRLLDTAVKLGYFILSLRIPEDGFYHALDPHFRASAQPDFYAAYAASQSLLALLELHEMSGNPFWLEQARGVNEFLVLQPVTEDPWRARAFVKLAQLGALSAEDKAYALRLAETIVAGEVRSLNPKNASFSSAAKLEGLANLAQFFFLSQAEHEWLVPEMNAFATFVRARQLPANDCNWTLSEETAAEFGGGIFSACEDPTIRVDGLQNWINGATAYLEYLGMTGE